jgi:hypothetical protein
MKSVVMSTRYLLVVLGLFFINNRVNTQPLHAQIYGDSLFKDKIILTIVAVHDTILAGTKQHGLFRSTDHGLSWQNITRGLANNKFIYRLILFDTTVYLSIGGFMFESIDYGATWRRTFGR